MRKLLMLAAMALAAMAFAGVSATAASADYDFDIFTEQGEFCPEVSLEGNEVSGGCLIEDFEGIFELYAAYPYPVTIGQYAVTFDLALDSKGQGYAVNPTVEATGAGLGRSACDESDGTVRPWAVESRSPAGLSAHLEMDITLGLRATGSGPGGACSQQEITIDVYSWYGTWMDQTAPSANIRNGHWESSNTIWIVA